MSRAADRLPAGEQLVVVLRGHGYALTGPALVLIVTSGLASFLAGTVPPSGAQATLRVIIAGTAAGVVARWTLWPFGVWYAHSYVLTTRRLMLRDGVFARRGRDIPLNRVIDVRFHRSVLQRMLGCGTLTVSTAGAGPAGPAEAHDAAGREGDPGGDRSVVVIDDVPMVDKVHRELCRLAQATPTVGRPHRAAPVARPPAGWPSIPGARPQ